MLAYILINTETGFTLQVLTAIKNLKKVREASAVYGVYDSMVEVEAESLNNLKDTVTSKIRRVNQVRSKLTMIVMDELQSFSNDTPVL
jgi:DNA-binding Lrp family transcriptional regulator